MLTVYDLQEFYILGYNHFLKKGRGECVEINGMGTQGGALMHAWSNLDIHAWI
jgi:hypothetical protein